MSTAARASRATSKYVYVTPLVHPLWGPEKEPNHANLVTNTATSAASNARNHPRSGSTSANHGISHRLYCGEYTLFESRNTTKMGNARCHLGVSGCRQTLKSHSAYAVPKKAIAE